MKAESYLLFLLDPYGNYVVQKTLAVAEKEDKIILISKIKPEMDELRKRSDFGAKIYNKLIKAHPSLQVKGKNSKNKCRGRNSRKKASNQGKQNKNKNKELPPSQENFPQYQSYNQQPTFFQPQPPPGYYSYGANPNGQNDPSGYEYLPSNFNRDSNPQ